MLIAITPTGGRPDAFGLCERWMKRQTRQPDLWIVVDDCEPQTKCTMGQIRIAPTEPWCDGPSTQHRNILLALDYIQEEVGGDGHKLIMIEDDDHYKADYIEKQADRLDRHPLVGEQPARYYHVRHGAYHAYEETPHASLCSTALRSEIIPTLREACEVGAWIDMYLWRKASGYLGLGHSVTGIKGMPGRPGVSSAHRRETGGYWTPDANGAKLREWIGDDARFYERFRNAARVDAPAPVYDNPDEFATFIFAGRTHYKCPDCGFDSAVPANVTKHWVDSHKAEQAATSPGVTLFDADGGQIPQRKIIEGNHGRRS